MKLFPERTGGKHRVGRSASNTIGHVLAENLKKKNIHVKYPERVEAHIKSTGQGKHRKDAKHRGK